MGNEGPAMNDMPLETSIREESQRVIRALREKEAFEIERMEENCETEIEGFRTKIKEDTRSRILQELSRLENRAILERRKLKTRIIEDFIAHTVKEAVNDLRKSPGYKNFLRETVLDATGRIEGKTMVLLKAEDLVFEKELLDVLKASGRNPDIAIREDDTIVWGGCIVPDEKGGRIFNGTIERVYFRKSRSIRREVMRVLRQKGPID